MSLTRRGKGPRIMVTTTPTHSSSVNCWRLSPMMLPEMRQTDEQARLSRHVSGSARVDVSGRAPTNQQGSDRSPLGGHSGSHHLLRQACLISHDTQTGLVSGFDPSHCGPKVARRLRTQCLHSVGVQNDAELSNCDTGRSL